RSLRTNRLRTALSILGIVIGVASVIALVSVGTGAQRQVTEEISSLGSNLINVNPGFQVSRGGRARRVRTEFDVGLGAEIQAAAPDVKHIMPQVQVNGQLIHGQTDLRAG